MNDDFHGDLAPFLQSYSTEIIILEYFSRGPLSTLSNYPLIH